MPKKKKLNKITSPSLKKIIKRNGNIVSFVPEKIVNAIYKSMLSTQEGSRNDAIKIAAEVISELQQKLKINSSWIPEVEEVQDLAEKYLMLAKFIKSAKTYILYREKHAEIRRQKIKIPEKIIKLTEESLNYFQSIFSYVIYLRTYARWINEENRRETWVESVDRTMNFMRKHLGKKLTANEFREMHHAILHQEVMPSMRLLQFAGDAVESTHVAAYNCSYIAPTTLEDFGEIMYISMCGCGVGFSVESQNIQKLPIIKKQTGSQLKTHVVADDKQGWCDAFVLGMKTWYEGKEIDFDFSKVRPLGTRLKTFGGKASGPEPLRNLLDFTHHKILKNQGRRLSNIDAHDILCKIGEVVLAGGVRRSAMISLSDFDDKIMRDAKKGPFYYKEPQRSYANNSAVYEQRPADESLMQEWLALIRSGTGERGIFNRGSLIKTLPKRRLQYFKKKGIIAGDRIVGQLGTNPCGEIVLQSKQFCNLTEVIVRPDDDEQSLKRKIRIAVMMGTCQATLTHFEYLSKTWKQNCEEEALLGVSITGQWDNELVRNPKILEKFKKEAVRVNKTYAQRLGINPANAVTCIKPSGTVALVANCSSGMHPRYAPYYIRRVRIAATDALFKMLKDQGVPYHPEIGYAAENSPTYVLDFPMAAPKGAVFRNELTALDHLNYWKMYKIHYTEHNPSITVSIGKEEWISVLNWLTDTWDLIGGISFLPRFEDVYRLPPYQEISKQQYEQMVKLYRNIDFSQLILYERD